MAEKLINSNLMFNKISLRFVLSYVITLLDVCNKNQTTQLHKYFKLCGWKKNTTAVRIFNKCAMFRKVLLIFENFKNTIIIIIIY